MLWATELVPQSDTFLGVPITALGPFAAFGALAMLCIIVLWKALSKERAEHNDILKEALPLLREVVEIVQDRDSERRHGRSS